MKSTSRHVTGCYQSVVDNGRNHGLVLDLPEGKQGDNVGPTALELAGMALDACPVGKLFERAGIETETTLQKSDLIKV